MAVKSITRRWLLNSFSIILVILIVAVVAASLSLRSYYYNSVRQAIDSRVRVVSNLVLKYSDGKPSQLDEEIQEYVENFADRNLMELIALDRQGQPLLTSSGFQLDEDLYMPDYGDAKVSESGEGQYIGPLYQGENAMAVTMMIPVENCQYGAVRYVVSLTEVDSQIVMFILLLTLAGMAVIFFVALSSSYFIRSIVIPVGEIGRSAKKIASGDFQVRIEKKSNDEIGELVDTINDMAEELGTSEKMKNDFISSVSHELRTPLTAIRGWGETLRDESSDPALVQKGMGIILSETERLSQMVEELLDFSRMQSGRLQLQSEPLDLLAELDDTILMFAERAKREGIDLVYHEPDEMLFVMGDHNKLRQVFINVLDNALKYSDNGARVLIQAYSKDNKACIQVADTGIGISEEDLPKVKTKFYKGNSTRRGSGIGLAVADEIIKLHNGSLQLDSRQGVGTTVTILLPLSHGKQFK